MDLVLIHGRAQGGRSLGDIKNQWMPGLKKGFQNAGLPEPAFSDVRIPFYGDKLDELTTGSATSASIAHRGLEQGESFDPFVAEFVLQMARREGLTDEQLDQIYNEAGLDVSERGPLEWGWVHAIASYLDRKNPWLTNKVLDRVVADVKAYVDRPDVRAAVNAIVRPTIGAGPSIVISHSLGTVVAYWILAKELKNTANVPLFLTIGSPLGLHAIKSKIVPPPRNFPAGVKSWVNVTDPQDIVALTEKLNADTFLPNIDNISDVENGDEPHAIERYLADPRVAKKIYGALQ
jgi:hypothetical protein